MYPSYLSTEAVKKFYVHHENSPKHFRSGGGAVLVAGFMVLLLYFASYPQLASLVLYAGLPIGVIFFGLGFSASCISRRAKEQLSFFPPEDLSRDEFSIQKGNKDLFSSSFTAVIQLPDRKAQGYISPQSWEKYSQWKERETGE